MKVISIIKKNWILVWLIIVAFSLSATISYAAYTGTTTAKRVVSLDNRNNMLFSSRYMFVSGSTMQSVLFDYDEEEESEPETPKVVVDVCNYDVSGNVYDKTFKFKIKANLVDRSGNAIEYSPDLPTDYTISYRSHTGSSADYSSAQTLILSSSPAYIRDNNGTPVEFTCNGAEMTRFLFETTYRKEDISDTTLYGIQIEAEVVETYSDISSIWGKLFVARGGAGTENTWEGKFMDDTTTPLKPADYDGFNYQLSGNATGTVTLTYRSDRIEIDLNSLADLNPTGIASSTKNITIDDTTVTAQYTSLTISVNPEDKSMYDVRFYWITVPDTTISFDLDFISTEFEA